MRRGSQLARREVLRMGCAAASAVLAGCGAVSPPTDRRSSTTTAISRSDTGPPDVGPYTDRLVQVPDAAEYLFDYLPHYSWYRQRVPMRTSKAALSGLLDGPSSAVLTPDAIEEYFYGAADGHRFHVLRHSSDRDSLVEALHTGGDFRRVEESDSDLTTVRDRRRVVGVGASLWVDVLVPAYAAVDPLDRFRLVVSGVRNGRPSFVDGYAAYDLLTAALQSGSYIASRPSTAEDLGASAYGRQYVWVDESTARPEEVLVFEEERDPTTVRDLVSDTATIPETNAASIDDVAVAGRTATVTYEPLRHCVYMRDFQSPGCAGP